MEIRTLLVDSSYLLKRSFNGAKDVSTSAFGHIGGLYSFLTTVRKLIKQYKISENRIISKGVGWDDPVDPSHPANPADTIKNNRIEIRFISLK